MYIKQLPYMLRYNSAIGSVEFWIMLGMAQNCIQSYSNCNEIVDIGFFFSSGDKDKYYKYVIAN